MKYKIIYGIISINDFFIGGRRLIYTENAYAKINLYLDIESKREDGYHDILSVMQTVNLFDRVDMEFAPGENEINVLCTSSDIPCGKDNIAYSAAMNFFSSFPSDCGKITVNISKKIPFAAGLAGGSADGAAVLRILCRHYGIDPKDSRVYEAARKTGADLPFCLYGGIYETRGTGDRLRRLNMLPECFFLICKRGTGVSTPAAYRALDALYADFKAERNAQKRFSDFLAALSDSDLKSVSEKTYNIFEDYVFTVNSEAQKLKSLFNITGALFSLVSGSGPSVYGVYRTLREAEKAKLVLANSGMDAFLAAPFYPRK